MLHVFSFFSGKKQCWCLFLTFCPKNPERNSIHPFSLVPGTVLGGARKIGSNLTFLSFLVVTSNACVSNFSRLPWKLVAFREETGDIVSKFASGRYCFNLVLGGLIGFQGVISDFTLKVKPCQIPRGKDLGCPYSQGLICWFFSLVHFLFVRYLKIIYW